MANKFATEEKTIIVRRSICSSKHCLNPNHYYWGTRSDVAYENAERDNKGINKTLITRLREYLEQTSREKLLERRALETDHRMKELNAVPYPIYIG